MAAFSRSFTHTHKQAYTQLLLDISIHTFRLCLSSESKTHPFKNKLSEESLSACLFIYVLLFFSGLHSGWLQWSGGLSFRCSRLILKCSVKHHTAGPVKPLLSLHLKSACKKTYYEEQGESEFQSKVNPPFLQDQLLITLWLTMGLTKPIFGSLYECHDDRKQNGGNAHMHTKKSPTEVFEGHWGTSVAVYE